MKRVTALAAAVLTAATLLISTIGITAAPAAAEAPPAPPNSVVPFGNAPNFGPQNAQVNAAFIGMAGRPGSTGYWVTARDGGIFTYGDAPYLGSTGGMHLNQPVVGMAATPTGNGYWLVASDGGIFSFGDATFHGSTGSLRLNSPVMAMAAPLPQSGSGSGQPPGYWLVARDGGIFAFDVKFQGSVPGLNLASYAGSVDMKPSATGDGYYVLGADGGIFTFGDANFLGTQSGISAAAMALVAQTS